MVAVTTEHKPRSPEHTQGSAFGCVLARRGRFRAKVRGAPARCVALPLPDGRSPPFRSRRHLCHPTGLQSCVRRRPEAHLGGRVGAGKGARRGLGPFGRVRQWLPAARRGLGASFTERVGSASPESLLSGFFFFPSLGKGYSCCRDAGTGGGHRGGSIPETGAVPPSPLCAPRAKGGGGRRDARLPRSGASAAESGGRVLEPSRAAPPRIYLFIILRLNHRCIGNVHSSYSCAAESRKSRAGGEAMPGRAAGTARAPGGGGRTPRTSPARGGGGRPDGPRLFPGGASGRDGRLASPRLAADLALRGCGGPCGFKEMRFPVCVAATLYQSCRPAGD